MTTRTLKTTILRAMPNNAAEFKDRKHISHDNCYGFLFILHQTILCFIPKLMDSRGDETEGQFVSLKGNINENDVGNLENQCP